MKNSDSQTIKSTTVNGSRYPNKTIDNYTQMSFAQMKSISIKNHKIYWSFFSSILSNHMLHECLFECQPIRFKCRCVSPKKVIDLRNNSNKLFRCVIELSNQLFFSFRLHSHRHLQNIVQNKIYKFTYNSKSNFFFFVAIV